VATTIYNRDILRLAASIPYLRRLDAPGATAERRSVLCGSYVAVDLTTDEGGRVIDCGLEVRACAFGQASAALLGASIIGRQAREIARARDDLASYLAGRSEDPGDWPGLDVFADARRLTARHGAILLPFEASAEAAARSDPS
jgi:NifU-like protein involved in Fe-S cluster formation